MGREPMADLRNARELYEVDVRSGAYGERRWVIMPIAAPFIVLGWGTAGYMAWRIFFGIGPSMEKTP